MGLGLTHPSRTFPWYHHVWQNVTRLKRDVAPIGIGPTNPSQDFPVVPPRMAKRDELVWLCENVSLT
jgi:hypothetical protein